MREHDLKSQIKKTLRNIVIKHLKTKVKRQRTHRGFFRIFANDVRIVDVHVIEATANRQHLFFHVLSMFAEKSVAKFGILSRKEETKLQVHFKDENRL